jgi:adenylate cyclase
MNPTLCNQCEELVTSHEIGAEVELSLLFADVRGSTALAERVGATEFQRVIDRFYRAATDVFIRSDALVDKLVGDEVIALYVPGIAGGDHPRRAIEAAQELLSVTGHGSGATPWLPIGAGVHTGVAWIGAVGSSHALNQLTVLGDAANTAARLATAAGPGEILVSTDAWDRGGRIGSESETRTLELRGKEQPVTVKVVGAAGGAPVQA